MQCTYPVWWKLIFSKVIVRGNEKIRTCRGQITDEICLSAIPSQIFTISMQIPSLMKIYWYLLMLSSKIENTDLSWGDNLVENWRNLPINYPKPDLYNINAHTEFGENLLISTEIIVRKRKYVRHTDGQTNKRTAIVISYYPATVVWRGIKSTLAVIWRLLNCLTVCL